MIAVSRGKVCVLLGELRGLHANCRKGRCHNDLLLWRWPSPANTEAEARPISSHAPVPRKKAPVAGRLEKGLHRPRKAES